MKRRGKNAGKPGKAPSTAEGGMMATALGRILRPAAAYRWLLPQVASITPQYIEMVLRGALAGNHVQQWELFDLMLDTWPELGACQQELRDGVMERKPIFTAFADEDEDPTPQAQERCKLVSAALRRMRPNPVADENALTGTISDLVDGWFRGVVVLEVDWQTVDAGTLGTIIAPRASYWVHPVCFAFDVNGRLGLRTDAGTATGLGNVSAQPAPAMLDAFPPHKFLIGIHKAKSGTALGGALLRPLAWWWCAANFSADWLLNLAQVFGLPFRWANYDPNASQETVDRICSMLQNMGSAGWAAFPAGTTLELKDTTKTGDHSPQGELLDRADRYARLVILGQTMSGSQDSSKGGGKAFGTVEADVKARRINSAAKYVADVFNTQLIPSTLLLNYGNADDCPQLELLEATEGDYQAAQRDTLLAKAGLEIPKAFLRKKYAIPAPSEDEEVIGGSAPEADEEGLEDDDLPPEDDPALEAGDGQFHGNQWTGPVGATLPDENWSGTRAEMRERAKKILQGFKEPVDHPTLGKVYFSRQGSGKTLSIQQTAHDFQAVQALPKLIQRGKAGPEEGDNRAREGVAGFRSLESTLRIGRTTYHVQILLKKSTADGQHYVHRFYLHRLRHRHGPVKGKAASPSADPPALRLSSRGPSGPSNLPQESLVVKLQELAAIEDDALFAKALKAFASTL